MIDYNPRNSVSLVFQKRGSVFPKALFWAVPNAIATAVLSYMYFDVWGLEPWDVEGFGAVWSSFTFVLGFLIVFRTQQAYSRYWEGATLLRQCRGEWFNATSSVIAFCTTDSDKVHEVEKFQHLLIRLMSMLHCVGLQTIADMEDDHFEFIDTTGIDPESLKFLASFSDKNQRCEIIIQWVQQLVVRNIKTGVLPIAPPILSRFFQELSRGAVNITQAQNMTNIPFPFPYAQMLTVMLIIHWLLTPVVTTFVSGGPKLWWWSSLFTFVSILAFWGTTLIAAELESPFGDDANDLPLASMQADMNSSLWILLDQKSQRPPQFKLRHESRRWVTRCVTLSEVDGSEVDKRDASGRIPGRVTLEALAAKQISMVSAPSSITSMTSTASQVSRKQSSRKPGRYVGQLPANRLQLDGVGGVSSIAEGDIESPRSGASGALSEHHAAGGPLPLEPRAEASPSSLMDSSAEEYVRQIFTNASQEHLAMLSDPAPAAANQTRGDSRITTLATDHVELPVLAAGSTSTGGEPPDLAGSTSTGSPEPAAGSTSFGSSGKRVAARPHNAPRRHSPPVSPRASPYHSQQYVPRE